MLSAEDLKLFESISRGNPKFRSWLERELGKQHDVLVKAVEEAQVRRAQGHAQCLLNLIGNLDASR